MIASSACRARSACISAPRIPSIVVDTRRSRISRNASPPGTRRRDPVGTPVPTHTSAPGPASAPPRARRVGLTRVSRSEDHAEDPSVDRAGGERVRPERLDHAHRRANPPLTERESLEAHSELELRGVGGRTRHRRAADLSAPATRHPAPRSDLLPAGATIPSPSSTRGSWRTRSASAGSDGTRPRRVKLSRVSVRFARRHVALHGPLVGRRIHASRPARRDASVPCPARDPAAAAPGGVRHPVEPSSSRAATWTTRTTMAPDAATGPPTHRFAGHGKNNRVARVRKGRYRGPRRSPSPQGRCGFLQLSQRATARARSGASSAAPDSDGGFTPPARTRTGTPPAVPPRWHCATMRRSPRRSCR